MTVDKKKKQVPYKAVTLDRVHPNDWNPNELSAEGYAKLKRGISKVLQSNPRRIPPIIVRRHPELKGQYQIIDGFHRWKAMGDLKQEKINVFVIKADDATARILTNTLNYLRGSPNQERYAQGLVELVELGMTTTELSDLLPDTAEDIDNLISAADVSVEAYEKLRSEDEKALDSLSKAGEDEVWVELKFKVTVEQAQVVEQELSRLSNAIGGKSRRSRALEYMAVQSSQCDLPTERP